MDSQTNNRMGTGETDKSKQLRILYAAGPGNIIGTYGYWREGKDDPSQVSITYSSQFYDVCQALDAQAWVISSRNERQFLAAGQFRLEHRPIPWRQASGILYHLGQIWYGLGLVASAVRFRANAAVIADGTTYWFVLSLLGWLGVKVIPSLHCVLWRKYIPLRWLEKLLLKLNGIFFEKECFAALVVSEEISEQIRKNTGQYCPPIVEFLPTYRESEFANITPPNRNQPLFRVLFAGRIERDKGVWELLEIAKSFAAAGREDIVFDVCGDGSALEALRLAAKQAGVDCFFLCHGYCKKTQMREMFNSSHVIIVPTTSEFIEGFNKVVAEGILSGRPVVTSGVCPALSYVREAVVEVPPDDTKAYGDALLKLCDDRDFYQQKQQSCGELQHQFYDISRSWGSSLKLMLLNLEYS